MRLLPSFKLMSDLGAATADEMSIVYTQSKTAEEWYNVKFSKHNHLMKSHSLPQKILTLTGRFSVFGAPLAACRRNSHLGFFVIKGEN